MMETSVLMYAPRPNDAESFAPLAQFLEAFLLPVAYCDATHRYRYVNAAFASRFRLPASYFVGQQSDSDRCPTVLAIGEPNSRELLRGRFVRVERADESRAETHWWVIEYYPNRQKDGQVIGYFVVAREVTAQKELERAVGERGEQVRKLVEWIALPMARWNRQAQLVYCNSPYERWVGRPRSEVLGKTLAEIFGASAWAISKSSFERAFQGESTSYERQVHRLGAAPRWHRVLVFPDQTGTESEANVYTIAFDIDDDIRLRQQLAANEARFRSVLESIDVPIARFDPDFTVVYGNRPYAEFINREVDEIVGKPIASLIGDAAFAFVRPYYERAFSGESVVFDREVTHLDPPRWVRIRLAPDRDASGVARAVVGSVYDIDVDVRTRASLEAARKRLDEFADSVPLPLTYIDRDEIYRFANRMFLARHRLTADQVIGKHPKEARGEAVWSHVQPYVKTALNGEPAVFERPVTLANGEVRWTRTVYSPDRGNDGNVRGVYTTSFDIHELKVAQSEIARVDAELSAHLSRGPVAVVGYDRSGRVVEWSRRAEALMGFTREQMIGQRITLERVHPNDRAEVQQVVARILSGQEEIVTNTHRYLHRDGHYIWIEWYTSVIRDAQNGIKSIMSLGVDRTERLESRMRLQRLANRIPNPITYLNTEMRYEFMNEAFREWTGMHPEQVIGKTPKEARGVTLGGLFESYIKRALSGEEVSMERKVAFADGRTRWVRNVFAPDYDDEGKVVGCYNVSFDVHDSKLKEEALRRDVESDVLTGALSRRAFFAKLEQHLAACDGAAITLLFIDLDGFKAINDAHGHATGDQLLAEVAAAMRQAIDADATSASIGRLGGDEFVVMTRVASRAAVTKMTRDVIAAIESVPPGLGLGQKLSASIGVSQTISRSGSPSSDQLIRQADQAMYSAKRDGGGRAVFAD